MYFYSQEMDKATLDNKANQQNTEHKANGPGYALGWKGNITKTSMNNNKANQQNSEHTTSEPSAKK